MYFTALPYICQSYLHKKRADIPFCPCCARPLVVRQPRFNRGTMRPFDTACIWPPLGTRTSTRHHSYTTYRLSIKEYSISKKRAGKRPRAVLSVEP